jgi:elongation factor Ts
VAGISAKDVKALRDSTGAGMMDCKKALSEAEGDVEKAMELLRASGLAKAGKRAGRDTSEGAVVFKADGGKGAIIELGCETDFVANTPDFQGLAQRVLDAVAEAGNVNDVETALALPFEDSTMDDVLKIFVGKVGENVQLKRVASVSVDGVTGGYIHSGGTLAVLVALNTSSPSDDVSALAREIAMHVAAHDPTPMAVDRDGMPAAEVEKERTFLVQQAKDSGKPDNVIEKMVDGRMNKYFQENTLLAQGFVKDPDKTVGDLVKAAGSDVSVAAFVRFQLGNTGEAAEE